MQSKSVSLAFAILWVTQCSRMSSYFDGVVKAGSNAVDCMKRFDKDSDGKLNRREFKLLLRELFTDFDESSTDDNVELLFNTFDKNKTGFIEQSELEFAWARWISTIVNPVSALLIVDVQNDFITGSLSLKDCPAKQNPEEVVPVINNLVDTIPFKTCVYTFDWHPSNHISFFDNLHLRKLHPTNEIPEKDIKLFDSVKFEDPVTHEPVEQILWPRHCVQNSWGAELHKDLTVKENSVKIYKGKNPDLDSYSAFWDNMKKSKTELDDELRKRNITDVYTSGLAYDVCVGSTTLHALEIGYRTALIDDACKGVTVDGIKKKKEEIQSAHGVVVFSDKVKDMVTGKIRLFEMGLKGALAL